MKHRQQTLGNTETIGVQPTPNSHQTALQVPDKTEVSGVSQVNTSPEFKGIKTLFAHASLNSKVNTSPVFKGIKTQISGIIPTREEVNTSPEFKGIKTQKGPYPSPLLRSKYQP